MNLEIGISKTLEKSLVFTYVYLDEAVATANTKPTAVREAEVKRAVPRSRPQ